MSEIIWMNGEILPLSEARIGVEDRGFQFADGVYEVVRIYRGRCFALLPHLERLERSAAGIGLAVPIPRAELAGHIEKVIAQAGLKEGMIYAQLTRGAAPRNHAFPQAPPTLLFYTRALEPMRQGTSSVKLLSVPDERWKRCWVKSIALLPNVLAKNAALSAGADEAVFVEEGCVSECSASNFFAVDHGTLLTAPVGCRVLPGITRQVLLQIARQMKLPVVERSVTEAEAMHADELFITSTTREIAWVSHWNGRALARQTCGPVAMQLHLALRERVMQETA